MYTSRQLVRGGDTSAMPSVFGDSHQTFVTIDSRDSQASTNAALTTTVGRLDNFYQRFLTPVTFGSAVGSQLEMALYSFIMPYTAATWDQPHYLYSDQISPSAIGSEFRQLLAIIAPPELMGAPQVHGNQTGMIYGKVPEPLAYHRALPTDQIDLLQCNITAGLFGIGGQGTDWPAPSTARYTEYTFVFRKVS